MKNGTEPCGLWETLSPAPSSEPNWHGTALTHPVTAPGPNALLTPGAHLLLDTINRKSVIPLRNVGTVFLECFPEKKVQALISSADQLAKEENCLHGGLPLLS